MGRKLWETANRLFDEASKSKLAKNCAAAWAVGFLGALTQHVTLAGAWAAGCAAAGVALINFIQKPEHEAPKPDAPATQDDTPNP